LKEKPEHVYKFTIGYVIDVAQTNITL